MPALGTLRIEAVTNVSVPERLVNLSEFTITTANFPTLSREQLTTVVNEIKATIPREERVIGSIACLPPSIRATSSRETTAASRRIRRSCSSARRLHAREPDGEPVWSPIKEDELRFAVNTNWDLF
jgi:hypothetical protein